MGSKTTRGKRTLSQRLDSVEKHVDGWTNIFSGSGIGGRDPKVSTRFGPASILPDVSLTELYRGEGFAARVVDMPANDMVREWFKVEQDTDGAIVGYLDSIKVRDRFNQALKWARLFGGGLIVMGIDDGQEDMAEPLNEKAIKTIGFMHTYDKTQVSRVETYTDIKEPKYGQTSVFAVSPISGEPFRVHETRVLQFDGIDLPRRSRSEREGWGDSVLQRVYTRLRGLANAYGGIESLITEFVIGVLTMDNLQDLIASGQEDLVKKRLSIIDMSRHILNTVLVDKEEDYKRLSASAAGLHQLLNKMEQAMSAVTGIPVTLLMGQSPAGLTATGDSDVRFYYDSISAQQETKLRDNSERVVYLAQIASEGPTKGQELDGWKVTFLPLWQPTEAQIVETRAKQAETDERYINNNVLTPDEVTLSRFGGDEYSYDTHISPERKEQLESDITNPPMPEDED